MAIAQRMSTLGAKHPSLNFLSGLAVGGAAALAIAVGLSGQVGELSSPSAGTDGRVAPGITAEQRYDADVAYRELNEFAPRIIGPTSFATAEERSYGADVSYRDENEFSARGGYVASSKLADEQAATLDESLFAGAGVFDDTSVGSLNAAEVTSDVSREEAARAALDESLFAGNGVFGDTVARASSGALEAIRAGLPLTDEQKFMLELEYRWQHGVRLGGVTDTAMPAMDVLPPTLDWHVGVEG